MKRSAQLLLVYLVLLPMVLPAALAADVVLNEFLPNPPGSSESDSEWIELYNDSSSPVDISGWKLDDDPSTAQAVYVIPSGVSIDANGFKTFDSSVTGIQLSNSGDSVRLLSPDGTELDSYTYTGTTEEVSIGRSADGGGSWVLCVGLTKGGQNNCPLPTTTPIPTYTPTPTHSPSPTVTPNPPTNTLTPTKTPTPTKSATPTPTPTDDPYESSGSANVLSEGIVLGDTTNNFDNSPGESSASGSLLRVMGISSAFVAAGLALLSAVLVWQKRNLTT